MDPDAVTAAATRIRGHIVTTPALRLPGLDADLSATVWLKSELHQRTSAFKIRGALNKVLSLGLDHITGLVAASSGNHGRAVAELAQEYGIPAVIVLPRDVLEAKITAVRRRNVQVLFYDRAVDDRDALSAKVAEEEGFHIIPSSDDPLVAAGHGTVALELLAQAGPLDRLVVPVGGGGLAAGCATVAKAIHPGIEVIGVEPDDADDTARSLAAGHRLRIPAPSTIADGLRHQTPGGFTFSVNRCLLDGIVTVTDEEIAHAMDHLWRRCGLRAEPSGVCALAAVLGGRPSPEHRRIGLVLSGGNITPAAFQAIVHRSRPPLPTIGPDQGRCIHVGAADVPGSHRHGPRR